MTITGLIFQDPPVQAVELTLFFEPVSLKFGLIAPLMAELGDRFPLSEERFARVPWQLESDGPQLIDAEASDFPFPWLTFSNNEGQSIAFQNDRFMLRWEVYERSNYPGYLSLKGQLLSEYESFSKSAGHTIQVKRVRAEYDNQMPPNAAWTTAQRAFSTECNNSVERLESLHATSSGGQFHFDGDGVVTHVDFAARSSDDFESLSLRSTTGNSDDLEVSFDALDEAHNRLIECFDKLITSEQQSDWGKK